MILIDRIVTLRCRSPCGERGLKCFGVKLLDGVAESLPVRGAWIEMGLTAHMAFGGNVAPRAGSVD